MSLSSRLTSDWLKSEGLTDMCHMIKTPISEVTVVERISDQPAKNELET